MRTSLRTWSTNVILPFSRSVMTSFVFATTSLRWLICERSSPTFFSLSTPVFSSVSLTPASWAARSPLALWKVSILSRNVLRSSS